MHRRQFMTHAGKAAAGLALAPVAAAGYGFAASTNLLIDRPTVAVPNLPGRFAGLTVAFLTDIHHGPFVSLDWVAGLVRTVMGLDPDVIVLGGDYSLRDRKFIAPCLDVLAGLDAPLGVYAVLGNHDYAHGLDATRAGLKRSRVTELTNAGVWLTRGPDRVRLAGVDDLWHGKPDLAPALAGVTRADACVLAAHNPDFAETLTDARVGLVLSGHTHGGQVAVPGYGAPVVPSRYGRKYAKGFVEAPATRVYVSSGTGMSVVPVRANCRPEVNLITLV